MQVGIGKGARFGSAVIVMLFANAEFERYHEKILSSLCLPDVLEELSYKIRSTARSIHSLRRLFCYSLFDRMGCRRAHSFCWSYSCWSFTSICELYPDGVTHKEDHIPLASTLLVRAPPPIDAQVTGIVSLSLKEKGVLAPASTLTEPSNPAPWTLGLWYAGVVSSVYKACLVERIW